MRWKKEYWYYLIFAFCFAGFQFLEESIRANYNGNSPFIRYLLGIIPNFLPAIGIPALFVVLIPETFEKATHPYLTNKRHLLSLLISEIGLIAWEFQQIIAPKGTFDWNDVLWTIIGGGIFYLIWRAIPLEQPEPSTN